MATTHEPRSPIVQAVDTIEIRAEHVGDRLWHLLKRRPLVGVALAGAVGLAAAMWVGVPELAVGAGACYFAYRVLRNGEPPSQALQDVMRIRSA
jgi:hypothetical protein